MNSTVGDLQMLVSNLADELSKSGKKEISEYFSGLVNDLGNASCAEDPLERIINGGAIIQYANFSVVEDQIYRQIFTIASKLKDGKSG